MHVDLINIGSLLVIDLDADKVLIEKRCDAFVLEAFGLHHVALVGGCVADTQKDGLVFSFDLFDRLRLPFVPVDRVAGVL